MGGRETGGFVLQILGNMNIYVEDMDLNSKRDHTVYVIHQHVCARHVIMSTLFTL